MAGVGRTRARRTVPVGASFAAGVPHDLVAAFAASLTSTAPVLRRALPEATQERLLRAPAT